MMTISHQRPIQYNNLVTKFIIKLYIKNLLTKTRMTMIVLNFLIKCLNKELP
jgi:hypothetical protein